MMSGSTVVSPRHAMPTSIYLVSFLSLVLVFDAGRAAPQVKNTSVLLTHNNHEMLYLKAKRRVVRHFLATVSRFSVVGAQFHPSHCARRPPFDSCVDGGAPDHDVNRHVGPSNFNGISPSVPLRCLRIISSV